MARATSTLTISTKRSPTWSACRTIYAAASTTIQGKKAGKRSWHSGWKKLNREKKTCGVRKKIGQHPGNLKKKKQATIPELCTSNSRSQNMSRCCLAKPRSVLLQDTLVHHHE